MSKYNASFYPSIARTATPTEVPYSDDNVTGIQVIINVTAATSTPSVVPAIDGYDPLSQTWYNILTGVAITGTGATVLRVHPSMASASNVTAGDFLPETYRIVMTHGNSNSITYTVGVNSTS